jgi:hypothetical protein
MNQHGEVLFDWDRVADVMYVIRSGFNSDCLSNIDSEKIPGIVKRIDPETDECVGFIMHNFSKMFPANVHTNDEQLRHLLDISLALTNEKNSPRMVC